MKQQKERSARASSLTLSEFKSALENDATKRCEAQAKTIAAMQNRIDDDAVKIEALSNRCYALTLGALCQQCAFAGTCPVKRDRV